jgi:magnesium-protoporphyrin IX monomethyl ester (oxidative) cyclase
MSEPRNIERVLLVLSPYTIFRDEPKSCLPPLGLAYLAAVLEPLVDVRIVDAIVEGYHTEIDADNDSFTYGLSDAEIRKVIADYKPDMVGVSCLATSQWRNAHRMCHLAKEVNPEIITVMGGPHPTGAPRHVLSDPKVDYVVIGEGEETIVALLEALRHGQSVAEIEGLAYCDGEEIVVVPRTHFIEDMDSLPFPARHLLPMEKYMAFNRPHGSVTKQNPALTMVTSRGCPARCVFCLVDTIWGHGFRPRSAENVLSEIELLIQDYGMREIHFEDDNLVFDRERAVEIFQGMIDREYNLTWTAPNGLAIWRLDEDLLRLMKASGCYRIHLAIESGDPDVLHNIIHKPLNLDRVARVVEAAKRLDLMIDAFFVIGLPGETKEQIQRTFDYARELDVNASFFLATPYPGCELAEICETEGYTLDIPMEDLRVTRGSIATPEFAPEELERMISNELVRQTLHQIKDPRFFVPWIAKRVWDEPRWALGHARRVARHWWSHLAGKREA